MLGGRLAGFEWEEDHLLAHVERNKDADAVQQVMDLGQAQFAKLARTYGADPEQFRQSLSFEFKDATGRTLLRAIQEALREEAVGTGGGWVDRVRPRPGAG